MKVKTSELQGAALDRAVAKCEGFCPFSDGISWIIEDAGAYKKLPEYPTDWAHGGPILEREDISVAKVGRSLDDAMAPHPDCWCAHIDGVFAVYGPTPLVAAMRCYVASKLGAEVDVPDELIQLGETV